MTTHAADPPTESDPLPEITGGLPALRRDNPWPELPDEVEPFYLSLDGGGRHLITDAIRENDVRLMLEIGCFLCGSTRQWLETAPDLTVIGVDPWDGNWSVHIRMRTDEGNDAMKSLADPYATADVIQRYGNFRLALNNIRQYRDRFIPVRQWSPDALHYLHRRRIVPQMIYIDAAKHEDELWVAHKLFPNAIICGDDWNWIDEEGRYRMRDHVERFVAEHGFTVDAHTATWIIRKSAVAAPPPPGPGRPAGTLSWDAEAAERLLQEVDVLGREVLLRVAATSDGATLSITALADELGVTRREVLEAFKAINTAPVRARRPRVLGLEEGEPESAFGARPVTMAPDLAGLLGEGRQGRAVKRRPGRRTVAGRSWGRSR